MKNRQKRNKMKFLTLSLPRLVARAKQGAVLRLVAGSSRGVNRLLLFGFEDDKSSSTSSNLCSSSEYADDGTLMEVFDKVNKDNNCDEVCDSANLQSEL